METHGARRIMGVDSPIAATRYPATPKADA
jgi:hypothetical protein